MTTAQIAENIAIVIIAIAIGVVAMKLYRQRRGS